MLYIAFKKQMVIKPEQIKLKLSNYARKSNKFQKLIRIMKYNRMFIIIDEELYINLY